MIAARPLELKIQQKKRTETKIIGVILVILVLHIWRSRIEKSLKITSDKVVNDPLYIRTKELAQRR